MILRCVLVTLMVSSTALNAAAQGSAALTTAPATPAESRVQLAPLPAPGLVIHISPRGNDADPGTKEQPLASLERARDVVRSQKKEEGLPKGGVTVMIHGGEYAVTRTCTFSAEDSGTDAAPIVYRAAPGETPVFRGGVRLEKWEPLQDLAARQLIPDAAQARVWQCDLRAAGLTNLLPLKLGGFSSGHGFKTHPAHELFYNGSAMQLARGPNEGFLRVTDVAVKDGTKGYDRQGSKIGRIHYEGTQPSRWVAEPDLLLYGYWFWDWADSYERVASIDPETRLITLAEPWHKYGFSIGAPFYAINALSELDAPGEWYLDRRSGQLFFYAPSDPSTAVIELSVLSVPMLELSNVSHVRFEGLTWELGSADAILVRGGENGLFVGCTVRHFAGNGIEIRGGQPHGLLSCDIYSMGRGGTIIAGGDRKTLTPGEHWLENCEIHTLSRIDHTYTPAVLLNGVGNRLTHNRLHDVLSSAMRVEGNDHRIEFNEIFNAVLESDDQGGADMFGNATYRGNVYRFNYWHHIGKWRHSGDQPKCGQAGIRLDDAISGTVIFGNIFERCSAGKLGFGGVQIHGGKDNVIENNLFVDCAAAISFSPWPEKRWREFTQSALDNKAIDRDLYLTRYPQLAGLADNANRNHIRRNVTLGCAEMLRRAPRNTESVGNVTLSEGRFTLEPDNPIFHQPGFSRIPVENIGLYRDAWRTDLPARPDFAQAAPALPALAVPAGPNVRHITIPLPEAVTLDADKPWELRDAAASIPVNIFPAPDAEGKASNERQMLVASLPAEGSTLRRYQLVEAKQAHAAEAPFRWSEVSDKSLGLWEGERPVLVYNHGVQSKPGVPADRNRSTYIHPLYGLDGEVLTDDFPKDHYHHRGLFWAWPHVRIQDKHYDLWDIRGIHQRFERWLERRAGSKAAVLAVENGWYVGDRKVMQERVWVTVYPATADGQAIDLAFTWIPIDNPISLAGAEEKSYGGLTLRYAPRTATVITTPLGNKPDDLAMTRLPWADLSAQFAGAPGRSGAAVFISPDHPDYPPTWLTRHYGVLCVGWPGVTASAFQPGERIQCQYRVWLHRGATEAELAQAYQGYQSMPNLRWQTTP